MKNLIATVDMPHKISVNPGEIPTPGADKVHFMGNILVHVLQKSKKVFAAHLKKKSGLPST